MSSHVCVIMASRKWKLTHDETEASAQSLDSETYDSEFDDSDEKTATVTLNVVTVEKRQ